MAWTTRGTTNYFDAPTVAGTRYYYEVQAVNSAGASPPSNVAGAFVTGTLPGERRLPSDPSGHGYWMTTMNGVVF